MMDEDTNWPSNDQRAQVSRLTLYCVHQSNRPNSRNGAINFTNTAIIMLLLQTSELRLLVSTRQRSGC